MGAARGLPRGRGLARARLPGAHRHQRVPVQFGQDDFVAFVKTALDDTQVPPDAVELELTESALAETSGGSRRRLRDLKSLGLSFAVDDFGTGYSSLSHLQELPVDVIKIDISFVRQIAASDDRSPVIETIVRDGPRARQDAGGRGRRDAGAAGLSGRPGLRRVQGFLHGRPVPARTSRPSG